MVHGRSSDSTQCPLIRRCTEHLRLSLATFLLSRLPPDAPPGGESGLAVLNRSLPDMRDIVEKHAGETVLIVSHKATIRLLIGAYLGFDLRRYRGKRLPSRVRI